MSDLVPMTRAAYNRKKAEIHRLEHEELPKIADKIAAARDEGDLSENAEFHAAKERQAFIEGRITELEFKLGNADVIEPDDQPKDRAVFGCEVILENVETGEEVEYQLVGPDESDIEEGRISIQSPLGLAIIGKEVGEEIILQAPAGKRTYELVEIQ